MKLSYCWSITYIFKCNDSFRSFYCMTSVGVELRMDRMDMSIPISNDGWNVPSNIMVVGKKMCLMQHTTGQILSHFSTASQIHLWDRSIFWLAQLPVGCRSCFAFAARKERWKKLEPISPSHLRKIVPPHKLLFMNANHCFQPFSQS